MNIPTKQEENPFNSRKRRHQERSFLIIFFINFFLLIVVTIGALLIHFDHLLAPNIVLPVNRRQIKCSDESINEQLKPAPILFDSLNEINLIHLTLSAPFVVILLIVLSTSESSKRSSKALKVTFSFLLGFFSTILVTEVVRRFAGRLRPNFLTTCPLPCTGYDLYPDHGANDLMFCFGINSTSDLADILSVKKRENDKSLSIGANNNVIRDKLNNLFLQDVQVAPNEELLSRKMTKLSDLVREGRQSFPCFPSALLSYSSFFLALLVVNQLKDRKKWLAPIRFIVVILLVTLNILVGAHEVITNRNHVGDVIFGALLGSFISTAVYFFYNGANDDTRNEVALNDVGWSPPIRCPSHNNRLAPLEVSTCQAPICTSCFPSSTTNCVEQEEEDWSPIFTIPRVSVWRESIRRWTSGKKSRNGASSTLATTASSSPSLNGRFFN